MAELCGRNARGASLASHHRGSGRLWLFGQLRRGVQLLGSVVRDLLPAPRKRAGRAAAHRSPFGPAGRNELSEAALGPVRIVRDCFLVQAAAQDNRRTATGGIILSPAKK